MYPPGLETFPERLRKHKGGGQGASGQVSDVRGEDVTGSFHSQGPGFQRNAAKSGSEVLTSDPARLEPRAPLVTTLETGEARHRPCLCGGTRPPGGL